MSNEQGSAAELDRTYHAYAERLCDVAERASARLGRERAALGILAAAIAYGLRHTPRDEIVRLLKQAAERIERGEDAPTVN